MNKAHDEKISFCPASGSVESLSAMHSWVQDGETTHHHLPGQRHRRSVVLKDSNDQQFLGIL